ncbi:hypothetical protein P1P68_12675 [Streptomyces scabiei]|uniref:phage tail protein n=1 Tax=Streptomyces scabiei TaxID=1930 RepID=UPI00298F525F|nr:hypothetical protein [Streptomyces scabiei]MDW8805613.1 hypothetical protein [Streptomyces scabiei]
MSTPAGDGLVGDASIRVDADTDPAARALARFSRNAQTRFRAVQRSLTDVNREVRALRTATGGARINLEIRGQADIAAAAASIRDLLRDANGSGSSLRTLSTRSTAVAAVLRLVEAAAQGAGRELRTLRARVAAVTATFTDMRPAAAQAAAALRMLSQRAEGSVDRLGDLDSAALGASVRVDGLRDAVRGVNDDLRDLRGGLPDVGRGLRDVGNASGDTDRLGGSLGSLASVAGRVAGAIGAVAARVGTAVGALGAAVPVAAGLAATLQNIAPAAGLAATGILAAVTATAALKIGMLGVSDAFAVAFDPSKAEEFSAALAKLSPSARSFVLAVQGMKPQFDRLRLDVQERLFHKLGSTLQTTAKAAFPQVQSALRTSAETLNLMAQETLNAATGLSTSGALGKALGGATRGLQSFSSLPAVALQGLVQIGAAAAPAFERLSTAGGEAVARLSDRLSKAFESGAMERAINTAVSLVGDLVDVGRNIGSVFSSVFEAAQVSGGGFVGTLKTITGQLAQTFKSPAIQSALQALFQTMSTLATTAAPLLGSALSAIAPVLTALGPPAQTLIKDLGAGLSPIIGALGPVLEAAAGAVGALATSLSPLLPVIGNLVASLLPPLVPAINAIAQAWAGAAPIVAQLGQILTVTLAPIIAQLPAILTPLINTFTQVTAAVLPLVAQLLTALTPALTTLGQSFAEIMVAVGPLLSVLGELFVQALAAITPVLMPVITFVGRLAQILAGELATRITTIVVPALQTITSLLQGDFSGAFENAKRVASGMVGTVVRLFSSLPGQILTALATLVGTLQEKGRAAGAALLKALRDKVGDAVEAVKGLPGRARDGLGNLGSYLASAGRDLIAGMIGGVREKAGDLASAAADVVGDAIGAAKSALGISSPSKVFAVIGRQTGQGFIKGLTGTREKISSTTKAIAASITKAFKGTGSRTDDRLVGLVERGNKRLQSLAKQRDVIAKKIADAQKFATDLAAKARATGSLSSIVQPDFFAPSSVEKQMRKSLAQIKAFSANVAKLQKKGLSKALIRQILEMGPEAGAQFAASLAGADQATIKRFNKLQSQIGSASTKLGKQGADMLYDSGKKAGEGFLTGLKAQQKNIEKLMLSIAKGMQRAIRKALGIKSPARRLIPDGANTVLGLVEGVRRAMPQLDTVMGDVAGRMAAPDFRQLGVGSVRGVAGGQVVNYSPTFVFRAEGPIGSRMELQNWFVKSLDDAARTGRIPRSLRSA